MSDASREIRDEETHQMVRDLHTHVLGRGGLMDRMDALEVKTNDLLSFKLKAIGMALAVSAVVTLALQIFLKWK